MRKGNRELLREAAGRCLERNGLARTTARDVASEAGVSLAAIGYHFGTVRALLVEVALDATGEWGQALAERLDDLRLAPGTGPTPGQVWDEVVHSFEGHRTALVATFELLVLAQSEPATRQTLSDRLKHVRGVLGNMLFPELATASETERDRAGASYYIVLNGLMTLWLVDPESVPRGEDLAAILAPSGHG